MEEKIKVGDLVKVVRSSSNDRVTGQYVGAVGRVINIGLYYTVNFNPDRAIVSFSEDELQKQSENGQ